MTSGFRETPVTFVRGEMAGWSDFARSTPPAGGAVFAHVVARTMPGAGHALIVGPHDWDLVDLVVGRAERTTILLRGHVDAETAAHRYKGRSVSVVCGDFSALETESPVDVLVALDGLERTVSLEAATPPWSTVFTRMAATLAETATVLLAVENPISLVELSAVAARETRDDDAAWRPFDLYDGTRPSSPEQLAGLLSGGAVWGLHSSARSPSLMAAPGPFPEALIVAHSATAGLRVDPQIAMRKAVRFGQTDALSTGWVLVVAPWDRPPGIVADGANRVSEVRGDGERFTVSPVGAGHEIFAPAGWLVEPARSQELHLEEPLLESVLLDACVRRDVAGVRAAVRLVLATLRACAPPELGRWVAGTFDNVVLRHDGSLTLLDSTWAVTPPISPELVLIQTIDDFAQRLGDLGWRHPWPVSADTTQIAVLMAAAAGLETEPATILEQRSRQRVLDALRGRSRQRSLVTDDAAVARMRSVNEALRSKVAWFETAIVNRDARLAEVRARSKRLRQNVRRLEQQVAELSGSTAYRVGRAVTNPGRALKRRRGDGGGPKA